MKPLLAAILAASLAIPLTGQAQPAAKTHRIGFIATTSPLAELAGPDPTVPTVRAFVHGLRDLGYEHGRNLVLDMRTLEGKTERLEAIAAELARNGAEAIVLPSFQLAQRVHAVTQRIPIVAIGAVYGIDRSVVDSLARPGGMVTGISGEIGADVVRKRLELLAALLPKGARVAFVGTRQSWDSAGGRGVQDAARQLGIALSLAEGRLGDYSAAFAVVRRARPQALFIAPGPESYALRRQIGELAAGERIASSCGSADFIEYGCMMSYGLSAPDNFRRLAAYVDRILKGAKPGELPIEQPSRFEFVINLKAAKALGVSVPQSMLLRANRVIE